MPGFRIKISLLLVLGLLISIQVFSQQFNYRDSISPQNINILKQKPEIHYSVGSAFIFIPHSGSATGLTFSPFITIPVSRRLSVEGGIIAGRYYSSIGNLNSEGVKYPALNILSVYGSAKYDISPRLSVYGAGIKQIGDYSPFYAVPGSAYMIGSSYNFGNFSIGITLHMENWNNSFISQPFNGTQGFFSPFSPGPGSLYHPGW